MEHQLTTRKEDIAFTIASYVILAAAGVVGLRFGEPATDTVRSAVVILLGAIGLVQWRAPKKESPSGRIHGYLGVHGGLVAALMFLQPGWTMYPVLYVPTITLAILALPLSQGILWIAAYTLATATSLAVGISLGEGLIGVFLYGVLYGFFGAFASALARADSARRETQALLLELREAHEQLRQHALRAEELAVVEERNRLAREMHDTLGHRLTVASVQLEAAQRLCPTDSERAASVIGTVRDQVRAALGELRDTVAALRAPIEADLQLLSALRRLTDEFEQATASTVHRVLPEVMPPLPDAHRSTLFRAAQEALTNVQKHAEAARVWLVLTIGGEAVTLLVSDDGKGISDSMEHRGFGLQGLRERAERLGGELHLEPRVGGGTQFSLHLPLPKEGNHA